MENDCKALVVYERPRFILAMVYFHENTRAMAKAMFAPLFGALSDTAHLFAAFLTSEAGDA